MLTRDVLDVADSTGYLCVRGGFDPAAAEQMRAVVWRSLGGRGVREEDPATWTAGRPGKSPGRAIQDHPAFRAFWTPDVVDAVDALLGGCWSRPTNAGDILLTFPERSSRLRQLDPFHSDFAMDVPAEPMFAVKVFAFIGEVRPRSGGTLVIRGSHRVVRRYLEGLPKGFPRRRAATQFAADNPWLVRPTAADLIGATADCDGVEVRVEELTGAPGDVVLTHPWTLHAGVSNAGGTPRMMLGHRVFRRPAS